jgi:1-acyl-sn-glycerol-3-phosphate acyltransferase
MSFIACLIRLFTGVQAVWINDEQESKPCIYFANHTSHFDFLLLWSVLPPELRNNTYAAAAADYWTKGILRNWLAKKVFKVICIEREHIRKDNNPIRSLAEILDIGKSIIIFPEGGRNLDHDLKEFKSGIYHLASDRPNIHLIPVYIDNANRVLPKGECLPIPLICSVTFGKSIKLQNNESKKMFLERTQFAIRECAQR